jgi:Flp pilus assembly protein TadD
LDYIYSVSLVKSGAFATGITRLQALEQTTPKLADVHVALGEAYAGHGDDAMAVRELRIAVELNPADPDAKHLLALTLVKLQQHEEVPH